LLTALSPCALVAQNSPARRGEIQIKNDSDRQMTLTMWVNRHGKTNEWSWAIQPQADTYLAYDNIRIEVKGGDQIRVGQNEGSVRLDEVAAWKDGHWVCNVRDIRRALRPGTAPIPAPAPAPVDRGYSRYRDLVDLAADGDVLYYVRRDGSLLIDRGDGPEVFDSTGGARQVAADRGFCFVLKTDGHIWASKAAGGGWTEIWVNPNTTQILAKAGRLYALVPGNGIICFENGAWKVIDTDPSTKQIAVDRQGIVFALRTNNNIWMYDKITWKPIDVSTGTTRIEANRGCVYALKGDGSIWVFDEGRWGKIDPGPGTLGMVASGEDLFVVRRDGMIWKYNGGWYRLVQERVAAIAASRGRLYILRPDGTTRIVD
jgi:hypothetical protein